MLHKLQNPLHSSIVGKSDFASRRILRNFPEYFLCILLEYFSGFVWSIFPNVEYFSEFSSQILKQGPFLGFTSVFSEFSRVFFQVFRSFSIFPDFSELIIFLAKSCHSFMMKLASLEVHRPTHLPFQPR